jgi:tetratricopeptide (TPR) repeat protein
MQVHHKLAICLRALGNPHAAVEVEMQALRERDDWAETYVGLAETFAQLGRWDRVERWAKRALELGMPQSPLILNPLEFTLLPMLRLAEACQNQGPVRRGGAVAGAGAAASPGQPVVEREGAELGRREHGEALERSAGAARGARPPRREREGVPPAGAGGAVRRRRPSGGREGARRPAGDGQRT